MPHLGTRLIRGNRVSLAVHRQALKTIFDSALLLLRPRKFSGGPLLFDAMLFAAWRVAPSQLSPEAGEM